MISACRIVSIKSLLSLLPTESLSWSNTVSGIEGGTEVVQRSCVSVLVVDDCEQWRRAVCATLRTKLGLHVIEEARDGLEALQRAADLRPELVTLDIGLPRLNGIEVARQIRKFSPSSRVVFLTENHSCDFAEAAFESGARSYIVKSEFATEFIPAIEAVLEGRPALGAWLPALVVEPQTL